MAKSAKKTQSTETIFNGIRDLPEDRQREGVTAEAGPTAVR